MNREEFILRLRQHNETVLNKAEKAVYSRQRDEDLYNDLYEHGMVIKPPYDFGFLRSLYEESDVLQSSISAMTKNVVGMGYTMVYLGEDTNAIPDDALAEKEKLLSFFSEVNEAEEWIDVLSSAWEDYEITGNMAIEIIRNLQGDILFAYYHPVENLRKVAALDSDYVQDIVKIRRDGRVITTNANVFYRRYVAMLPNGSLRFYKSFGDPRPLRTDGSMNGGGLLASELLWIENKKGVLRYGLPRWIGSTFDVAGRRDAQVLNWDALRSQGISPMAILVNGRLSDDSWDEIWNMIMGSKGIENFNKIWVLQVAATPNAVGSQGSADVKIQDLSSAQKTDEMFANYLKGTEDRIRQSFRVPAGFLGGTGAYSYGTLKVAKLLGEEQVFGPERNAIDNKINRLLLRKGFDIWNWRYKTKAAEVAGPEEIRQAISSMVSSGAMSINNAVKLASDALGREFSSFPESWADYPLPLVLKVLDKFGTIDGMEEITGSAAIPPELIDITPTTPTTSVQQEEPPPEQEENTLELSEEVSSPFVGRGSVWAAAPRYVTYAYNKIRTLLRDAYTQALSNVSEQLRPKDIEGSMEEVIDRYLAMVRAEALSALSRDEITGIFAKMHNQITTDSKKVVMQQVSGRVKKAPVEGLPDSWEMNWTLRNQEAVKYFSSNDWLYLSKYVESGGIYNKSLNKLMANTFVSLGIDTKDKTFMSHVINSSAYIETPLNSASNSYLKMMINTGVARAQNFGSLMTMAEMGVQQYKVVGPKDALTCSYCWAMMDRSCNVKKDYDYWKSAMVMGDDPAESHALIHTGSIIARFNDQPEHLNTMSTADIQDSGPAHPPFHPNCRHTIIADVYKSVTPVKKPVVDTPLPPVETISATTSSSSVTSDFLAPDTPINTTSQGIKDFLASWSEEYKKLQERVSTFIEVASPIESGTYPLTVYKDPATGEEWLFKACGERSAQSEALAYKIGQMINPGSRVPVYSGDLPSRLGHASGSLQKLIPKDQIAQFSINVNTLTKPQLEQLMKEEAVDTLLGNWDAHKKNFLILTDGRLVSLDKGQSFKYYLQSDEAKGIDYGSYYKSSTVYSELNKRLRNSFSDTGSLPFNIDHVELLKPIVHNIASLKTPASAKLMKEVITSSLSSHDTISTAFKKRVSGFGERFSWLYGTITNDSGFAFPPAQTGATTRAAARKPIASSPLLDVRQIANTILGDKETPLHKVFIDAYNDYSKLPASALSNKDKFDNRFPYISVLLDKWSSSSSSAGAILLKAVASKLEGLGSILLNSRRFGEQPEGWSSVSDYWEAQKGRLFGQSTSRSLSMIEQEYVKARAFGQVYLKSKYPKGSVPVLYRGARVGAVRDILLDPTTPFPVNIREQVLASFSTRAGKATRFGTIHGSTRGYDYHIKKTPITDVAFHDTHMRPMEEYELIIRSKEGRLVNRNQIDLVKAERVLHHLLSMAARKGDTRGLMSSAISLSSSLLGTKEEFVLEEYHEH